MIHVLLSKRIAQSHVHAPRIAEISASVYEGESANSAEATVDVIASQLVKAAKCGILGSLGSFARGDPVQPRAQATDAIVIGSVVADDNCHVRAVHLEK
jgi:hypothetical protein